MSVQEDKLKAIADAIRVKKGTSELIVANDFASEILSIETGGVTPSGTIEITENGTYDVTEYASANVNVASAGGGEDMLQQMVDNAGSCAYLFYNYGYLTSWGSAISMDMSFMKNLNTSNVVIFERMFASCRMREVDVSGFDTSNVKNMASVFESCSGLTSLDLLNWNTSKVITFDSMFSSCSGLTSLDLSNFDTSNATTLNKMFSSCYGLTSLDLSNFDTSKVTNMSSMFSSCYGLTSLDLSNFDTSKVTSLYQTFYNCNGLTSLNLSNWDTSNVTSMYYLFNACSNLETIIGTIDLYSCKTSSATNSAFAMQKIVNLTLKNIRSSLTIGSGTSYGHKLSVDSLINTIKELWDYSSETTTYKLTMGSTNTTKLADIYVRLITPTAEQIEADPYIESKKPCEVCASTDEGAMLITAYAQSKNWQIS